MQCSPHEDLYRYTVLYSAQTIFIIPHVNTEKFINGMQNNSRERGYERSSNSDQRMSRKLVSEIRVFLVTWINSQ